jgi:hypothetical protein
MFTTLDPCPRTIACHENGPVQELKRRFLEHLATQSATPYTIMAAIEAIYCAAIWRKLEEPGPVERNARISSEPRKDGSIGQSCWRKFLDSDWS